MSEMNNDTAQLLREAGFTADAIANLASHLGDSRDKQAYSEFYQRTLGKAELEEAQKSWLPGKITWFYPDEMTREGRTVKIAGEDPKPFADAHEAIGTMQELKCAYAWGRLYGGGGAYMIIKNDDPRKPLDLSKISPQNPIATINAFDMHDVATVVNQDPRAENYLRPETYQFSGGDPIHWTRVLGPFDGYKQPNRMQLAAGGWGGSEVERVSSVVLQSLSVNQSVASLCHRADSLTVGIKGLMGKTQNATKTAELARRFAVAAALMSNNSFFLYDMDDEIPGQVQAAISGIGGMISEMMSLTASAVGAPVSRFFGTAPKGLNATGEGDRKDHQSNVSGKQKDIFGPALRRLDPVVSMSIHGRVADIDYNWNPLEQMSELEGAQAADARASAHQKNYTIGAVLASHVSRELQARGEYAIEDEFIDDLEQIEGEEPNAPEFEQTPFGGDPSEKTEGSSAE